MTRFEKVIQILDTAVGGPTAPVSFHGAFWRGLTRNQFIDKRVFGLKLVAVGNGAGSNLVKALKGELPFGADTGNPDADFNRMPSGRPIVPPADIAFIQKWIDEGCPEDEALAAPLTWRRTGAPVASSRTDDIWFLNPSTGWAVNSDGNILKTADGGATWAVQHTAPGVYLRCVGFANANIGWVGTLTRNRRLFRTTDGGQNWSPVSGLPVNAPVAVCGLAVVNDKVIYGSGTNRPGDTPAMLKTTDGGVTWTAWDMSAHASILIDTFFTDELHGWVVGGKADRPNPTDRSRIKPVVLQTADGGATWTNRLAGQDAQFPSGEWGWKIQFLNATVGFISLENFTAGAILKTTDGGLSWTRLKVNDPQGNANLEGIGFVDADHGWVGGWGSADFTKGFSSATTDGGNSWQNANDIGKFLNRFRFFGDPVSVGYASGDTVYKYSAEPVTPALATLASAPRPLLPSSDIQASSLPIPIPMNIPNGTRRLTVYVWDRFGKEVGSILDEVRPKAGVRTLAWDGQDTQGREVPTGEYIVRVIADDAVASSIVQKKTAPPRAVAGPHRANRTLQPHSRPRTIAALLADAPVQRDLAWLAEALQIAIQLELTTLPPYLTARWTITNPLNPVARSIREIWREEMVHFGLACNLLVAIGGQPVLTQPTVVPKYPGGLPGGVRPGLTVALKRLTKEQAGVFMEIEYPDGGPIAVAPTFNSIGAFYKAVLDAFQSLNPPLDVSRQLASPPGVFKIETPAKVKEAIELINRQGEGSNLSPEDTGPNDLAHYYRFKEIHLGKKLVKNPATGRWEFTGADVPLPETWPMADIPEGGYQQDDVPDPEVWNLITRFDQEYSAMLRSLESAWWQGSDSALQDAIGNMFSMGEIATELVQKPRADGNGNYGPCFRFS